MTLPKNTCLCAFIYLFRDQKKSDDYGGDNNDGEGEGSRRCGAVMMLTLSVDDASN